MPEYQQDRLAKLADEEMEALERRLTIASSKLQPRSKLRVRGKPPAPGHVDAPHPSEIDEAGEQTMIRRPSEIEEAKNDIIENYRRGVKIASQAESRPLLPLLEAAGLPVPPELAVDHEHMKYDFYTVQVTFSSLLPADQFPAAAELGIVIRDDVPEPKRSTRPLRLFPGRKDKQLFSLDLEGAVGLDAGLNFAIPKIGEEILPYAKASADAKLKAALVLGPFQFQFRRAAIEVIGESDQNILWRYNMHSELTGANEFKSFLLLKVAQEATQVTLDVSLGLVPCKRKWLIFKDMLPPIPDRVPLAVELAG